ncbi:autotransporter outer membrane beta-barrel domain-containing protein [Leminorella grimontii]|uniref:autotransporter outer membrane beta-barrel domain-containing protein n=1 Tax=Leminorella grimontii TaxID=82981 RepID=UPI0032204162
MRNLGLGNKAGFFIIAATYLHGFPSQAETLSGDTTHIDFTNKNISAVGSVTVTDASRYWPGLVFSDGNGTLDLGSGSSVTSTGFGTGDPTHTYAVYIRGNNNSFKADDLTVKAVGSGGRKYTIGVANDSVGVNDLSHMELTGLTSIDVTSNQTVSGILSQCLPLASSGGTTGCNSAGLNYIKAEDLLITLQGGEASRGIESAGLGLSYRNASLTSSVKNDNAYSYGLYSLNGYLTSSGNTSLRLSGEGKTQQVIGIYASGKNLYNNNTLSLSLDGSAEITLSAAATSTGSTFRGVMADNANARLNDTSVVFNNQATTESSNNFYGIYSRRGSVTVEGNYSADFSDYASKAKSVVYLYAPDNGNIQLNKNVSLGSERTKDEAFYAMYASNGASINVNDGKLTSYGIIESSNAQINANAGDNSYIWGRTSVKNGGQVNLTLSGQRSVWDMTANSSLTDLALNQSTLNFLNDGASFKTLSVAGDYSGQNGLIVINTQLGDDASPTDRLEIAGNTSGRTYVAVNNIGGQGADTINGIELITVGGNSDGTFEQSGRIVAGLYDYFLVRGQDSATEKNWYLTSALSPVTPVNPDPEPDPQNDPIPDPKPEPAPADRVVRPESGSYLANRVAANTMFITRLHDRLGETQYTDVLTGERRVTSLWLRQVGGHNRFRESSEQLKTQSNRYVAQMGGDIAQWYGNGNSRLHLGLMAGYGNSQNNTQSSLTHYRSRGQVEGYSVGAYGTWYANEANKTGAYLDGWIQYGWFKNQVNGDGLATEKYRSKGISSSLEGGYSFKVGEKAHDSYWLQPKAQVVWMGIKADDHREENGSMAADGSSGNLLTRLGLRAYAQGRHDSDADKQRLFQPFVEINWLHLMRDFAVEIGGEENRQVGAKDVGEVKLGVEGQINANFNVWGNVAQQIGADGYSDTSAQFGVKYLF